MFVILALAQWDNGMIKDSPYTLFMLRNLGNPYLAPCRWLLQTQTPSCCSNLYPYYPYPCIHCILIFSIDLSNKSVHHPTPYCLCHGDIIHTLLTRQSVHVDSLGRQADAHVPAYNKRRRIQTVVDFTHYSMHPRFTIFVITPEYQCLGVFSG